MQFFNEDDRVCREFGGIFSILISSHTYNTQTKKLKGNLGYQSLHLSEHSLHLPLFLLNIAYDRNGEVRWYIATIISSVDTITAASFVDHFRSSCQPGLSVHCFKPQHSLNKNLDFCIILPFLRKVGLPWTTSAD